MGFDFFHRGADCGVVRLRRYRRGGHRHRPDLVLRLPDPGGHRARHESGRRRTIGAADAVAPSAAKVATYRHPHMEVRSMKVITLVSTVALSAAALVGCNRTERSLETETEQETQELDRDMDRAGDRVQQSGEEAADELRETGRDIVQGVEELGDDIDQGVDELDQEAAEEVREE